jgi:drug/metabolite transporter (DMT)-like permease
VKNSIKIKGIIYGIIAAVCYGTNPLGALYLYADKINVNSVLFYRYFFAAIILGILLIVRKESFIINKRQLKYMAILGVLFAFSSLSLFGSFHYIDAGIASTLLFVYPVMVALIMAVMFKEKVNIITILSIALSLAGIALLYKGNGKISLNTIGVLLVMISSLTYAIYIIIVNKSSICLSSIKQTFFVLLFGIATILLFSFLGSGGHIQRLVTIRSWSYAIMLAIVPTVISLVFLNKAIDYVGSTPTAILGALEPLTAVVIGVCVFKEAFTLRLACGIVLILSAVILIILGKTLIETFKKKKQQSL